MRHALADLTELPRFRHSVGDLEDPATHKLIQTTRPFLPLSFAPAGSTLMMTATDLISFARIFLDAGVGANGVRVLSAESAAQMTQPTAAFAAPSGWRLGLGWMLIDGGLLHHSGGGPGVSSVLYVHPASGRALALLTNCNRHDALKASFLDPIVESWTGTAERAIQRRSEPFDSTAYLGVYESKLYRAEVLPGHGALTVRLTTKSYSYETEATIPPGKLHSLGDHAFDGESVLPGCPNLEVRFANPDIDGRMRYLAFMARVLVRAPMR